ncbi:MAG TPA: hypothetical protein P5055_12745, partial [Candidatus Paceibacterota bacterium]|nr:hypothetical protein [Verrucomicrobiota bacterium]HSA01596.1 hypothetical protein [Candidatus Paceibacterota bacterium]
LLAQRIPISGNSYFWRTGLDAPLASDRSAQFSPPRDRWQTEVRSPRRDRVTADCPPPEILLCLTPMPTVFQI